MEQWEKSYYITAIAGSTNGSSLVVMSKGQNFTFSCYCTCLHIDILFSHHFPISSTCKILMFLLYVPMPFPL